MPHSDGSRNTHRKLHRRVSACQTSHKTRPLNNASNKLPEVAPARAKAASETRGGNECLINRKRTTPNGRALADTSVATRAAAFEYVPIHGTLGESSDLRIRDLNLNRWSRK